MKPGDFNTSDLNLKRQALAHLWGTLLSRLDANVTADPLIDKAASFMSDFFESISKDRYDFFVETQEEPAGVRRLNPMEGAYPYGRTGKSSRDPLHAFFHFKYSKTRKPVARLIKPGKYTPFHPTDGGDIATPYTEEGSKMRRGPSGKYRHIASYGLDELVALGWDGAKYVATQGKHAAVGQYVPFIPGYDSDDADEYEPIDVQRGKLAGVIGLSQEEAGLYMTVPDPSTDGGSRLVQLNNAR